MVGGKNIQGYKHFVCYSLLLKNTQGKLKVRDSKFGRAFVIVTSSRSGAYVLGFRAETRAKLQEIYDCVTKLRFAVAKKPNFGVRYTCEESVRYEANVFVLGTVLR